jgi:hypothetical protein
MRKLALMVLSSMAAAIFVLAVTPSIGSSQTQGGFADVAAGGDRSFAFNTDGSAWRWGDVDHAALQLRRKGS